MKAVGGNGPRLGEGGLSLLGEAVDMDKVGVEAVNDLTRGGVGGDGGVKGFGFRTLRINDSTAGAAGQT
jgi:hypothetical protein